MQKPLFLTQFGAPDFFFMGFTSTSSWLMFKCHHSMQFPSKSINQTLKNDKKTNFGPNFGPFAQFSFVVFKSSKSWTLFQAIILCNLKEVEKIAKPTNFWPEFGSVCPKFSPQILFFDGILALLDFIHCCKLSLYSISRKTNKPHWRKWQKTWFPE